MATKQSMTKKTTQASIKASRAAIMAVREADNPVNYAGQVHTMSRSNGPVLRHPVFDWKATDKYQELCNFEIEVKNIFITNNYNTQELTGSQYY